MWRSSVLRRSHQQILTRLSSKRTVQPRDFAFPFRQQSYRTSSSQHRIRPVRDLRQKAEALQKEISESRPLIPAWASHKGADDGRIGKQVEELLQNLRSGVRKDEIQLFNDKHRREISATMRHILHLLSYTGDIKATKAAVNLMSTWNFEMEHSHCHYAMLAAARSEDWEFASQIFLEHVDPDRSGYNPYDIDIANPIGLYVLARQAEVENMPVAERVMEAVKKLVLVSPGDEEKYLLAAGYALGIAGQSESFVRYLEDSFEAKRFGQPLVAAVMQSCMLCGEYEASWNVFQTHIGSDSTIAAEHQWGGGQDRMNPLCRDLAICSATAVGNKEAALVLLQKSFAEKSLISTDSLEGIAMMFESESDVDSSVTFLFGILKDKDIRERVVDGASSFLQNDGTEDVSFGGLLASVLRNCNAASDPGLSLLILKLFQDSDGFATDEPEDDTSPQIYDSLSRLLIRQKSQDLLSATIIALGSVGSRDVATELHKEIVKIEPALQVVDIDSLLLLAPLRAGYSFLGAMTHVDSLLCEKFMLPGADPSMVFGSAIEALNERGYPRAAFYLALWLSDGSIDVDEVQIPRIFSRGDPSRNINLNDYTVACAMQTFLLMDDPKAALLLLDHLQEDPHLNFNVGVLSGTMALRSLILQQDFEGAMSLFQSMLSTNRSPEIFYVVMEMLTQRKRWNDVLHVYRMALSSGCSSEETGLYAMEAVSSSKMQGKQRMLRKIADDTAALVGLSQEAWLKLHYWSIKRRLGDNIAARLMFWEDDRSALDELELALESYEKRTKLGLEPKKDTIRCIITAAKLYRRDYIDSTAAGLPRVPRTHESWERLFRETFDHASRTDLIRNPGFLHEFSLGCANLGLYELFADVIGSAIREGVPLNPKTLTLVVKLEDESLDAVKDDALFLLGDQ